MQQWEHCQIIRSKNEMAIRYRQPDGLHIQGPEKHKNLHLADEGVCQLIAHLGLNGWELAQVLVTYTWLNWLKRPISAFVS